MSMHTTRSERARPMRARAKPADDKRVARSAASGVVRVREERIDLRVKSDTKALLIQAAEQLYEGNLTAFIVESAKLRATEVVERLERLRIANADRDRLLAALDNPPAPNDALRRAFVKYA